MDATMLKIQQRLDHIMTFLDQMLPMANCHMVEFFTEKLWDRFVPKSLAEEIQNQEVDQVVETFWKMHHASINNINHATGSQLSQFIANAHSRYLSVDSDICLSIDKFEEKIIMWGQNRNSKPEIHVKEFMNSKKSYEVQIMSRLVASLAACAGAAVCVDAGGGRGQLPAVLALGYGVRGLTVDCDPVALRSGKRRERLIQKQWHAIAKKSGEACTDKHDCRALHKFVEAYVNQHTDLVSLVKDAFPDETDDDTKLLLTGLHTCGELGADSLRLFASQAAARALLSVPCCHHLLSEPPGEGLWGGLEGGAGAGEPPVEPGFPMSHYMRGARLGRCARMLAAQSLDRAAAGVGGGGERAAPGASGGCPLPKRTLLYRAVLQVIIKEHLKLSNVAEGKLKQLSKCKSLREYVTAADGILQLGLDRLSEAELEDIFQVYSCQWDKLVAFYLLRLCLAQVVEGVILLDRLLYLKECGFKETYLVRLFDPVLSPRCHGLVAMR